MSGDKNLSPRVLVTGGSRGIGKAIVQKLLEDGFRVISTTRKSDFPDEFLNNENFEPIIADFSEEKLSPALSELLDSEHLPDVIINNAAIFEPVTFDLTDEVWEKGWNRTLTVNLMSPLKLCRLAINSWKKYGKSGIIINISSRAAYRGETAEFSNYAASKAALVALTKTIARGFGKDNIYAFTVAPGFVHTDMAEESIEVYGKEYLTKDLALNEIVPPEEVAEIVALLASGKLKHMTGQTLHINSGSYLI